MGRKSFILDDFIEEILCLKIVNSTTIHCNTCTTNLKYDSKQGKKLVKHLEGKKHTLNQAAVDKIKNMKGEEVEFPREFIKMMIKANISLRNCGEEGFCDFFEKWTGKNCFAESHIEHYF